MQTALNVLGTYTSHLTLRYVFCIMHAFASYGPFSGCVIHCCPPRLRCTTTMTFVLCKCSYPPRATFAFSLRLKSYDVPSSPEDVLADAEAALEFRSQTKDGALAPIPCKHDA